MKNIFDVHKERIAKANKKMPKAMYDVMNAEPNDFGKWLKEHYRESQVPDYYLPKEGSHPVFHVEELFIEYCNEK